jgi:hypothetical protein
VPRRRVPQDPIRRVRALRHLVNRFIRAGFVLVRLFNNAQVARVVPVDTRVVLRAAMAEGQAAVAAECAVVRTLRPQAVVVPVESRLNHLFYQ